MSENVTEKVEESRRKFLKTAGKIAVYTPPAMLALSRPSYATFAQSSGTTYKHRTTTRHRRTRLLAWLSQWF
jgi:hypothetical protein